MAADSNISNQVYPMRLQRFLARSGVASRRGSEDLMAAGRGSVNGKIITELGSKVDPLTDKVCVDGRPVEFGRASVTLMLNKPAGYLTTMSDPFGRPTVAQLVPVEDYPGLFPVGRLDFDTTGLLLFSTDGNLGHELLRPYSHVEKRYYARVSGKVRPEEVRRLSSGVPLEDGMTLPAKVRIVTGKKQVQLLQGVLRFNTSAPSTVLEIALHEGRNRQIKRMCEYIGHPVLVLHRFAFAGLDLHSLKEGKWCMLNEKQISALLQKKTLQKKS